MSTAAGAPPPPPPPPPPRAPNFDDLPAELLLMIYEYIGLSNYMNLALAIYPSLQRHGLVPVLTVETLIRIINEWQYAGLIPSDAQNAASRMPTELWLQIAGYLEPADTFTLVFGIGNHFYRFWQRPTKETISRLRIWSRRSRKK
ncbi:uncharacterized protein K460DRAFT_95053 [Cucurbitaria berberidis CBS 394.84]|uniref:F-box domain-containing protein n=1 Tax=Cucurbitaria berberidis CBS 394.84 TaxID=1168544 RepID=A0A9P4L7T0_9PLEO|nr:uncharacterized protein K460DRAFT_95053 [Cucurbitaria berberidis CBS 394.84]KAF1844609.1 hypothetical protein K460DRAFT_95053 [Cucurbitaria berberidis CBS 394.84]